jgi:hypothetical protein
MNAARAGGDKTCLTFNGCPGYAQLFSAPGAGMNIRTMRRSMVAQSSGDAIVDDAGAARLTGVALAGRVAEDFKRCKR